MAALFIFMAGVVVGMVIMAVMALSGDAARAEEAREMSRLREQK